MTKTSVYLADEDVARLAVLAEREGASQAEIIRRAIRGYRARGAADRNFAMSASGDGPGGSIADVTEEDMLAGFGA